MPVAPYTEPNIKPVTTWPEIVNERIAMLWSAVDDLRQQVKDLQSTQQAMIVTFLNTEDGDENDDTDF